MLILVFHTCYRQWAKKIQYFQEKTSLDCHVRKLNDFRHEVQFCFSWGGLLILLYCLHFRLTCVIKHQHLHGWDLEALGTLETGTLMKGSNERYCWPWFKKKCRIHLFLDFDPNWRLTARILQLVLFGFWLFLCKVPTIVQQSCHRSYNLMSFFFIGTVCLLIFICLSI